MGHTLAMSDELRLSAQLKEIAHRCHTHDVTVGELASIIKGSPYFLIIALLSLPFMLPIPGLATLISIPIGILFIIIGLRLCLGQRMLIPDSLKEVGLSKKVFPAVLKGTSGLLRALEKILRPRGKWLFVQPMYHFYGLFIVLAAIMLMPPFPIPYANFMPALTLFLISIALIEKDGLFMVLSWAAFAGTIFYYYLIKEGIEKFIDKFWG